MMDQNADGLVDVADLVALHGIMGRELTHARARVRTPRLPFAAGRVELLMHARAVEHGPTVRLLEHAKIDG